jgi:uncharacterized membrane protein (DUF485 family)
MGSGDDEEIIGIVIAFGISIIMLVVYVVYPLAEWYGRQ